jgi:hypothetical protein
MNRDREQVPYGGPSGAGFLRGDYEGLAYESL